MHSRGKVIGHVRLLSLLLLMPQKMLGLNYEALLGVVNSVYIIIISKPVKNCHIFASAWWMLSASGAPMVYWLHGLSLHVHNCTTSTRCYNHIVTPNPVAHSS